MDVRLLISGSGVRVPVRPPYFSKGYMINYPSLVGGFLVQVHLRYTGGAISVRIPGLIGSLKDGAAMTRARLLERPSFSMYSDLTGTSP